MDLELSHCKSRDRLRAKCHVVASSSENHRLRRGSRISAGCQKVYFDLVRKDLLSKVKSAALNIETGASKQFLRLRVISSRLLNFGDLYRQCRSCPSTRSCIIAVTSKAVSRWEFYHALEVVSKGSVNDTT